MSETPRTDAKEKETQGLAYDSAGNADPVGMRNHAHYGWKFARTLERELAAATRERDEARTKRLETLANVADERDALRAEVEKIRTEGWPKLDKPARVGGGTFHVGVSAKLVVSAAQAAYANEAERRAMTKEQRHEAERNRREFWDMVNGPLEAKP